jgi:hypothetical protein
MAVEPPQHKKIKLDIPFTGRTAYLIQKHLNKLDSCGECVRSEVPSESQLPYPKKMKLDAEHAPAECKAPVCERGLFHRDDAPTLAELRFSGVDSEVFKDGKEEGGGDGVAGESEEGVVRSGGAGESEEGVVRNGGKLEEWVVRNAEVVVGRADEGQILPAEVEMVRDAIEEGGAGEVPPTKEGGAGEAPPTKEGGTGDVVPTEVELRSDTEEGTVCPNELEGAMHILFSPELESGDEEFGQNMLSTQISRQINRVESFLKVDRLRRQKTTNIQTQTTKDH